MTLPALRRLLLNGAKRKIHTRCLSTNTPTTNQDADAIIAELYKNSNIENTSKINGETSPLSSTTSTTTTPPPLRQINHHDKIDTPKNSTNKDASPILDVGSAIQKPAGCLANDDDEDSYIPYVRIEFVL